MRWVIGTIALVPMWSWWVFSVVVQSPRRFKRDDPEVWSVRWLRRLCPFVMPAWVTVDVVWPPHPWWLWPMAVFWPIYWWGTHKVYCKDKHGRRLMEAGRGFVERFGNRLVVVPEAD